MKKFMIAATLLASSFAFAAFTNQELAPLKSLQLKSGESIIVDGNGMSVYTFDIDEGSVSKCYDACAQAWPPVLLPEGVEVNAPLGTTAREDGTVQITVNGQPVYLFIGDRASGDINGDGLDGVWHLIGND